MRNKLFSIFKPFLKTLFLVGLVFTLAFGHADGALAARTGGRIGGGSFRAPTTSRPYSGPRSYTPSPGYGYGGGGYGGGFGFPFVFPFPFFAIGGGFGGLFTILIFFAIANFLVNSFRRAGAGDSLDYGTTSNPQVSVAKLQVGLLSEARSLQADLNRIAEMADTSSSAGLTQLLQETSLALLRHPEYWVYAGAESGQTRLEAAEAQFNRLALAERSKFGEETLTNINNQRQLKQAQSALAVSEPGGALANTTQDPGEYIVATLLVGTLGKLQLPAINSPDDLRRALSQIGAIGSDQLLAVEVLWTPQAEGDTLTSDDLLVEYSNLKLI